VLDGRRRRAAWDLVGVYGLAAAVISGFWRSMTPPCGGGRELRRRGRQASIWV
jgi:hypothetical protein